MKNLIKKLKKSKTFKNKVVAIILEILGILSIPVCEGDATAFIFLQMFAIPLFFAKKNCIID